MHASAREGKVMDARLLRVAEISKAMDNLGLDYRRRRRYSC